MPESWWPSGGPPPVPCGWTQKSATSRRQPSAAGPAPAQEGWGKAMTPLGPLGTAPSRRGAPSRPMWRPDMASRKKWWRCWPPGQHPSPTISAAQWASSREWAALAALRQAWPAQRGAWDGAPASAGLRALRIPQPAAHQQRPLARHAAAQGGHRILPVVGVAAGVQAATQPGGAAAVLFAGVGRGRREAGGGS